MKIFAAVLFLIIPLTAYGQNQNMPDMQKLGMAMQEMMQCMAQIDRGELAALEQKSEQFQGEIDALCAQGKRDEAQDKAIAFSKQMMNEPALKAMQKCGEINKKYGLPEDPDSSFTGDDFTASGQHICDEMKEE